ncbi:hypothetical protein BLAHAN_05853 [Blautia hansenii DSM 20583]|uniref:Uncharacterized protein n=1 Tax=Blautia hansenii DSM 20583 TaxID=537007 RepID=C9L8Y1_BLAHA|nr:hypothetical protein BLAHAN_05853 [Blautia hansenii DSM 20583]
MVLFIFINSFQYYLLIFIILHLIFLKIKEKINFFIFANTMKRTFNSGIIIKNNFKNILDFFG